MLFEAGAQKITFVGGEPMLIPYLRELVSYSKELGMITMLVTNGSRMTPENLDQMQGKLDWIGLSCDTGIPEITKRIGRGGITHINWIQELVKSIHERNIKRIRYESIDL